MNERNELWISLLKRDKNIRNIFFESLRKRVILFIKNKHCINIYIKNLSKNSDYIALYKNDYKMIDDTCNILNYTFIKNDYKDVRNGLKSLIMTISYGESVEKATSTFIHKSILPVLLKLKIDNNITIHYNYVYYDTKNQIALINPFLQILGDLINTTIKYDLGSWFKIWEPKLRFILQNHFLNKIEIFFGNRLYIQYTKNNEHPFFLYSDILPNVVQNIDSDWLRLVKIYFNTSFLSSDNLPLFKIFSSSHDSILIDISNFLQKHGCYNIDINKELIKHIIKIMKNGLLENNKFFIKWLSLRYKYTLLFKKNYIYKKKINECNNSNNCHTLINSLIKQYNNENKLKLLINRLQYYRHLIYHC